MGTAMWLRLHDRGVDPLVYDNRAEAMAPLAQHGAVTAADPAGLAAEVKTVLLSLPTSAEVEQVAVGPGGLIGAARPGTLVVDLTSGLPAASRQIAGMLNDHSIRYVDAGVSGGVDGARAGALKVMVGGAEDDVNTARGVLDELASRVWHCGPVGSGHTVKTLLNQANQGKLMVELEALLVAARSGIDPHLAADVLDLTVWNHWLLGPDGRRPFGFALALVCKDFDIALRVANESGVPVPLAAAAQQAARLVLRSAPEGADLIDGVAVQEGWAGVALGGNPDEEREP
jgi:3-hydroxyisobutyrate dehydrogenase